MSSTSSKLHQVKTKKLVAFNPTWLMLFEVIQNFFCFFPEHKLLNLKKTNASFLCNENKKEISYQKRKKKEIIYYFPCFDQSMIVFLFSLGLEAMQVYTQAVISKALLLYKGLGPVQNITRERVGPLALLNFTHFLNYITCSRYKISILQFANDD